jgi:predicted Co/Zn/Cd cation transporter (cation efflux family)
MLEVDARSWLVSACLSLALLIGFVIAAALAGTQWQDWIPYLDAIALLSMALIMLPMPLIGLWRSISDVLQVAPDELDARVHAVMDSVVKERQFLDYSSYIAKVGRGRFVEIHVLVSPESRIDIETADAIRSEVSQRLNAGTPTFWLTIDFTRIAGGCEETRSGSPYGLDNKRISRSSFHGRITGSPGVDRRRDCIHRRRH